MKEIEDESKNLREEWIKANNLIQKNYNELIKSLELMNLNKNTSNRASLKPKKIIKKKILKKKKKGGYPGVVAHACNRSYLGS